MLEVLVVGLGSVGKKWIDRTTQGWPARYSSLSRTIVLHLLARREQSADFSGLLRERRNFEYEILDSPETL